MGDATRILNALKGNDFCDGDPKNLANCEPQVLMKIWGLGAKRVAVIAKALESMGIIGDAEEWFGRIGRGSLFLNYRLGPFHIEMNLMV